MLIRFIRHVRTLQESKFYGTSLASNSHASSFDSALRRLAHICSSRFAPEQLIAIPRGLYVALRQCAVRRNPHIEPNAVVACCLQYFVDAAIEVAARKKHRAERK